MRGSAVMCLSKNRVNLTDKHLLSSEISESIFASLLPMHSGIDPDGKTAIGACTLPGFQRMWRMKRRPEARSSQGAGKTW